MNRAVPQIANTNETAMTAIFSMRVLGPSVRNDANQAFVKFGIGIIIAAFGWDQRRQEASFGEWFDLHEASIIVAEGSDVGWMQVRTNEQEVFLGSLDVKPELQRRGIGTHVVRELITRCQHSSKALTLAAMKANPAIHLYERPGFRITHDDQYKFYMQAR